MDEETSLDVEMVETLNPLMPPAADVSDTAMLGAKSPKGSVMTKVGQSAPDSADLSTMNPILHNANMADDSTHSKASRSLQQRKYSYSSLGDGDHGNRDNSHGGSPSNYVLRNRSSSVSSGMSGMSLVDEVVENIHQAEVAISNAVMKEAKEFDQQFKATLLGHRTFHIAWTSYVVGLSFFGASVICAMTGNSFVDCLFHATSCVCSAGLSVMGANTLPKGVFIVQGLLAFFGGGCMMLLPTLIYRCICLRKYIPQCAERVKEPDLEDDKRIIIEEYLKIYYGSLILAAVIVFYILVWHICGTLMLFAALHRKPMEPELLEREFTFFDVALYTTVSAFANAGVTLSSKSLVHMGGNSVAIFVVTAVILAGNILMPVFLRWMLDFCLYVVKPYEQYNWITSALQYILDNPRKLTTHLFDRSSTLYLFQVMLLGKMFLFMYFLASNWYRETMYKYGDLGHVAGLGLFQLINLRHAGFQVFDLRDISSDMLFVAALAMFFSPMPGIKLLHNSAQDRIKPSSSVSMPPIVKVVSQAVLKVWFLRFLVILCMGRSEDKYMTEHPDEVNFWFIVFELVSAFGLVGVSMGIPDKPYSLSGAFQPFSKLLVVLTFIMGKNRAMPKLSDHVIHFYFPDLENALLPSTTPSC